MALEDVLGTTTLDLTAGVVLSSLGAEATVAVAMAGERFVNTAFPVVTGLGAVDTTFGLTC